MADIGAHQAPNDLVELGRIVSAYGVRGWVKVQPHSAQGLVLRAAPVWWLAPPSSPAALTSSLPAGSSRVASTPAASTPAAFAAAVPSPAATSSKYPPHLRSHAVKQVRPQGSTVVADLEHVSDRDIAESMRGYTVHVSRQYFPKAQADEFYWVDLVGCYVFHDSQLVGQVEEVVDNGAHAILRVQRMQIDGDQTPTDTHSPVLVMDVKGRPQDFLVPFVAAHVQHVDIAARRIETDWPLDL